MLAKFSLTNKIALFLYIFCCISWFSPYFHPFWNEFDRKVFFTLNSIIAIPFIRPILAILNHNIADWFYDLVMLGFFIPAIFRKKEGKLALTFEFVGSVLWTGLCFISINRILIAKVLHMKRASPGWIFQEEMLKLTDYIDWIRIKQFAFQSYPADHGTTICMFIFTAYVLLGKKVAIRAFFASLPFLLPRLTCGAHWFTDVFFGSIPLVLLHQFILFGLPFFRRGCRYLQNRIQNKVSQHEKTNFINSAEIPK